MLSNGVCMKNITMAKIVKTTATPTLFLMFVPLSEALLLNILNNDIINNTQNIINNILSLPYMSYENPIFLKKIEYESIKTSEFPNKNDNPTNNPFTNKNPTIGIIKYRISLNPNIINDIKTHAMRNTDG